MIALDDFLMNLPAPASMAAEVGREQIDMYDLCTRVNITEPIVEYYAAEACQEYGAAYCLPDIAEKCQVTSRPLDFVYDRLTDSYDLSPYKKDLDLVAKV